MIACCRNGDRAARDYLLAAIIATSPDGSAAFLSRSPFKRYQADKPLACYVFDQVCVSIRILAKATTRARMAVPKIAPRYNFEIKTEAWPQQQPASVPIHIASTTTSNSSYQRLKPTKACAGRLDTLMTGYDPRETSLHCSTTLIRSLCQRGKGASSGS